MNESRPPPKATLPQEIRAALTGAGRLFLFDHDALRYFNMSPAGFWRSFIAAAVVAPVYLLIVLLQDRAARAGAEAGQLVPSLAEQIRLEIIAYPLDWLLFPIVMLGLARLLKVSNRYTSYITAYNWAGVIIGLVTLLPFLLYALGLIGARATDTAGAVAQIVICAYLWFIARLGLGVPGITAAGLVAINLLLSMLADGLLAQALGMPVG